MRLPKTNLDNEDMAFISNLKHKDLLFIFNSKNLVY